MTDRPLLLVDVDGPLNPWAANPNRRPDGYETHRLRPEGWKDPRRKPLRVWLKPAHGPALLALPFDLVWCTTWAAEANDLIGPAIGLPDLPVVEWPDGAQRLPGVAGGPFWKTEHVVRWAAGRPFAWVDDDLGPADREYVAAHHDGPALLHHVDPRRGLLAADFDALTAWAEALHVPAARRPA
ncbi:hypothetical protein [Streptomyces sp. NPDC051994]|uniref:hypothetical protein n=1 Tax=unclassified Streptomyces TaxID=2593676 RepID=UPI00342E057C